MSCVFGKKSKPENTPWKLVARLRGKLGVERNWRAEKPAMWVQEERSKPESPLWKLINRSRGEKWAWEEENKRKNKQPILEVLVVI